MGCRIWGGKGGGGRGGGVCCFCGWEEGPALGCSGHIFFAVPSPLSLLLFKFTLVSLSFGWFILLFFLCFLGDVKGTVGVFGVVVVVEGLGDAAGADVTGAGVAGVGVAGVADAGVTGGFGVAAAATAVGGAFFEEGIKMCFFPPVWGTPSSYGSPLSSPPRYF